MARLNTLPEESDSDDLPELSNLLGGLAIVNERLSRSEKDAKPRRAQDSVGNVSTNPHHQRFPVSAQNPHLSPQKPGKKSANPSKCSKDKPHCEAAAASRRLDHDPMRYPSETREVLSPAAKKCHPEKKVTQQSDGVPSLTKPIFSNIRSSPSRKAKQDVNYYRFGQEREPGVFATKSDDDEDDSFTDLSGFIVDDDAELSYEESDPDDEVFTKPGNSSLFPHTASRQAKIFSSTKKKIQNKAHRKASSSTDHSASLTDKLKSIDLAKAVEKDLSSSEDEEKQNDSSQDNSRGKPVKISARSPLLDTSRTIELCASPIKTPPPSPSKSRLNSPSKKRSQQIPLSPHKPNIDAFWSSAVVNEWNEQYSPRKTPGRGRGLAKFLIHSDNDSHSERSVSPSPIAARVKSKTPKGGNSTYSKSKMATNKARQQRRKAWDERKDRLAHAIFDDLDKKFFKGNIAFAHEHLGGVEIRWSKTLSKTAGRATRSVGRDGIAVAAYVELSDKIIDQEDRLVQTLAHEFCHIAVYYGYGHGAQAHGREFWDLADEINEWFENHPNPLYRGRRISTRHDYEIDFKFVWMCTGAKSVAHVREDSRGCGLTYGRHSKSIDPLKKLCGRCRGVLLQVQPAVKKADLMKIGYFSQVGQENLSITSPLYGNLGGPEMVNMFGYHSGVNGIMGVTSDIVELGDDLVDMTGPQDLLIETSWDAMYNPQVNDVLNAASGPPDFTPPMFDPSFDYVAEEGMRVFS
ncbi:MAG: hypothetical protein Q9227_006864 [Pyrenula ochraceoflavens]